MKVSESLTAFIMLLLLIVLLLTIVILGIILWSLVVYLSPLASDIRNYSARECKKKKEQIWSGEDNNDSVQSDREKCTSLIIEDIQDEHSPYQYGGQERYGKAESVKDWNQYSETGQNREWEMSGQSEEELFAEEELQESNIEIKVTLANLKKVSHYQESALLKESEDGEIVIYKKSGEEYYADPVRHSINERNYEYTALKSCFDVNSKVESGYSYAVEVISSCILIKNKNYYIVKRKGKLQINKES